MKPKRLQFPPLLFLLLLGLVGCQPGKHNAFEDALPTEPFELSGISIDQLQQNMQSGAMSSLEITQLYIDRIMMYDTRGPALHAVIKINPDAREMAMRLDAERKQNKIRGPLHGVPVLIKDNIDTQDPMPTTAGSLALLDNKPDKDAFIVQKLREAGAVILGKANLSEWANFRSTNSISGWSSVGGLTKNPYVLDLSPCGSSSGSAVAVSADFCMVAIGTETDGSIACPASLCGVVGIKPTVGLVSRSGVIPISKSQDSPGPIARSVRDAAILLGILAGYDPNDEATLRCVTAGVTDYTPYLQTDGLQGKRIGVEKSMRHQNNPVGQLLEDAITVMERQGAIIIDVSFSEAYDQVADQEFEVLKTEFKYGINQYLAQSRSKIRSLEDLVKFNTEHDSLVMPLFKQEIMIDALSKGGLDSKPYLDALSATYKLRSHLDQLMTTDSLDALCGVGSGAYSPAAVAGYPSITIPMGMVNELPYGITFLGKAFDEPGLLSIGYAYEQASHKRQAPKYLPTNKAGF